MHRKLIKLNLQIKDTLLKTKILYFIYKWIYIQYHIKLCTKQKLKKKNEENK